MLTDGCTDRQMDRQTDEKTDGCTDELTDGWTDRRTKPLIDLRDRKNKDERWVSCGHHGPFQIIKRIDFSTLETWTIYSIIFPPVITSVLTIGSKSSRFFLEKDIKKIFRCFWGVRRGPSLPSVLPPPLFDALSRFPWILQFFAL